MSQGVSKPKKAYGRKLFLAHCISTARHDLHSLEAETGMPRRTLQDAIKAMDDIGIVCRFVQDGPKHRHGYYQVLDWGDHDPDWVAANLAKLVALLS
ncbi:MAG: helix-turn-helix domain-containing protein [Gammaproteobacteria bacterium]|nr:helix-turn-helix domain-containing protein [Gammaproteobacteria bacterium]